MMLHLDNPSSWAGLVVGKVLQQVEAQAGAQVELQVPGLDLDRSLAELLRHVEALQEAGAELDRELVAEVEVHAGIEVVAGGHLAAIPQVLADLTLPVGVVGDHHVGPDVVVDERQVGAEVRAQEATLVGAEPAAEVEPGVPLIGLLLDPEPGDLVVVRAPLAQKVGDLEAPDARQELMGERDRSHDAEAAAPCGAAEVLGVLPVGLHALHVEHELARRARGSGTEHRDRGDDEQAPERKGSDHGRPPARWREWRIKGERHHHTTRRNPRPSRPERAGSRGEPGRAQALLPSSTGMASSTRWAMRAAAWGAASRPAISRTRSRAPASLSQPWTARSTSSIESAWSAAPAASRYSAFRTSWPGVGRKITSGARLMRASEQVRPPALLTTTSHASSSTSTSPVKPSARMLPGKAAASRPPSPRRPWLVPHTTTATGPPGSRAIRSASSANGPTPAPPPITRTTGRSGPRPSRARAASRPTSSANLGSTGIPVTSMRAGETPCPASSSATRALATK